MKIIKQTFTTKASWSRSDQLHKNCCYNESDKNQGRVFYALKFWSYLFTNTKGNLLQLLVEMDIVLLKGWWMQIELFIFITRYKANSSCFNLNELSIKEQSRLITFKCIILSLYRIRPLQISHTFCSAVVLGGLEVSTSINIEVSSQSPCRNPYPKTQSRRETVRFKAFGLCQRLVFPRIG